MDVMNDSPSFRQRLQNQNVLFLYAKQILTNRIFLGYYKERRYVENLKSYRDVVIVSPAETELHADLNKIIAKQVQPSGVKWIGITVPGFSDTSSDYSLWVNLSNLPFGHYWFQIRHVKFEEGELVLKLKCIRAAHSQDNIHAPHSTTQNEGKLSSCDETTSKEPESEYKLDFDPAEILSNLWMNARDLYKQILPHLTKENFIKAAKLFVILIIGSVALAKELIHYLGEYTLRFLVELRLLIKTMTPIILQMIDFVTKVIGGLYILIARKRQRYYYPSPPQRQAIQYNNKPKWPPTSPLKK